MKVKKRPNIIFILSDQHSAKILGYQGHPDVKTPNLDALAQEGVSFDNALTQNPICTPSRISFLSGQYCHNHGYYGNNGGNAQALPSLFGHFRKNGYMTGAIGKIHCPEYWVEDDTDYFREVSGCSIGGSPEYHKYLSEKGLLELSQKENMKSPIGGQCLDGMASEIEYRHSKEGWSVSESINFVQNAIEQGKPFMLFVGLPKPHQCYFPAKEFWEMYDEENLTLPPNVQYEMEGKAPHLIKMSKTYSQGKWAVFEPKTFDAAMRRKLRGYLGCVSQTDYAVGELMNWVKDNGIEEDTIIIYTSDHGDYACEHGIMEKAPGICSDAVTRIPFIWKWKGHFAEGHRAKELVEAVDVSTTLCYLAGIEPLLTSDGKNICHLLEGKNGEVRDISVTEFVWSKSVRKGNYRLVYYPRAMFSEQYPDGFGELYDLEKDPWEMKNLYFEEEYSTVVQELERDLMDWIVTTTRPRTVIPPYQCHDNLQLNTRHRNSQLKDGTIHPDWIKKSVDKKTMDKRINYI